MSPSPSPHARPRNRFATAGRALLAAGFVAGGVLAAGVLSKPAPAAPEDCLPVIGCVTTTTVPPLPLPTVTLPTLPTTTTTTTPTSLEDSAPTNSPTETTASAETPATPKEAQAAFSARASVRIRGRGASRVVEMRLRLTKPARVTALLSRNGRALARRQIAVQSGSSVLLLRIGRATKPGAARLTLTYRANSSETARATYRLRLPR
jgi:hypothetical protein